MTSVSFGNYNPLFSSPLDTTGDINVVCDMGMPFTVKLGPGQHSGGNFQPRSMVAAGVNKKLNYNLYIDSTRIQIWGDDTPGTFTLNGMGTGIMQKFTVYGRIPERQDVSVGSYSDIVTVTVTW